MFFQVTMREEHRRYVTRGAEVVAPATCFDIDDTHAWSRSVYGGRWASALVHGLVRSRRGGMVTVRWEDNTVIPLHIDYLGLSGETLRTAQTDLNNSGREHRSSGGDGSGGKSDDGDEHTRQADGSENEDSVPLAALVAAADPRTEPALPAGSSDSSYHGTTSEDSMGHQELPTPSPRRGNGRSRGGNGGIRGRGGDRGRGGRGRGKGTTRAEPEDDVGLLELEDTSDESEESGNDEEEGGGAAYDEEEGDTLKVGEMEWRKNQGRTIDPYRAQGHNRPAAFKLHAYTEKTELDYFLAAFPSDLVPELAVCMTEYGQELGFGASWEVTVGEVWRFLGYNMAIMLLHTGGPKKDLWLEKGSGKYQGALFNAPDLGQYGLDHARFTKMMRAFRLPTYGDLKDPFNPVRRFVDRWNIAIARALEPGPLITVDESMALWTGKRNRDPASDVEQGTGMPGWMFVGRKPTNKGRESHTTADCDSGCIIFVEPYEGKTRMGEKEFVQEWGKNPAKAIRCVKPWFGSGRIVIADAGFASVKCAHGLAEHGLYLIGNVKGASTGFPKKWVLDQLSVRGDRACATATIKLSSGETWKLLAAGDKDKQPMVLIGTAGTTNMGEPMVRTYSVLKADGSTDVRRRELQQWDIHSTYRRNFNVVDMHNAKRQGPTNLEDTWKTHAWWVREFQMLLGMSEVNAYLLWRRFKPGQASCAPDYFRRRLTYQLMYNPVLMREIGERLALRARVVSHHHVENPKGNRGRTERRTCRYCPLKTKWSCACAPCLPRMTPAERVKCIFICGPGQNPECMDKHRQGIKPDNKRACATKEVWAARKRASRESATKLGRPRTMMT